MHLRLSERTAEMKRYGVVSKRQTAELQTEEDPLHCSGQGTIQQDCAGSAAQLCGGDHRNCFLANTGHCLRMSFKYTATKYLLHV